MYNANNNVNPLISLLSGLTGGGGQQQQQPQPKPAPQQGGGGGGQGNPLMELLTAMVSGQNAMNALTNILPQAAQMLNARGGGQNMEQFVRNEYQNQGVDINAAMQQLKEMMGSMNNNNNNYGGQNTNAGNNTYGGQNAYNGGQGGYNAQGGNTNNTNNMM